MRTISKSRWVSRQVALALPIVAGLLVASLALGGCGSDSGADPGAGAVPVGDDGKTIAATRDGITAFITTGDYLAWVKEPAIRDAIRAHGGRARSFFNSKYLQARRTSTYPMPLGAMAIKELYTGTTLYGYTIGVKTRAGEGAQTWTWYETNGLPDVDYFGVGNATCEGCHGGAAARDRSLTAMVP